MCKLYVSVAISIILCAGCSTPPKAPYPEGAVRKLNLDKRPVPPKSAAPAASAQMKK